jgi:hypothetical protein
LWIVSFKPVPFGLELIDEVLFDDLEKIPHFLTALGIKTYQCREVETWKEYLLHYNKEKVQQ